jgi:hypothetical protein
MRKSPEINILFGEGSASRLPTRNDGLEVQAKVCANCGQLELTYRESTKCIVCGGTLRLAKREIERDGS